MLHPVGAGSEKAQKPRQCASPAVKLAVTSFGAAVEGFCLPLREKRAPSIFGRDVLSSRLGHEHLGCSTIRDVAETVYECRFQTTRAFSVPKRLSRWHDIV